MSTEGIRLRLYAIITAIEEDIRDFISGNILTGKAIDELFDADTISVLRERQLRDYSDQAESDDLLTYTNLGDVVDLLAKEAKFLGTEAQRHFKAHHQQLAALIAIRNRVMHVRPLMFDDLPTVINTANSLVQAKPIFWPHLQETLEKLRKDKSYLFKIDFVPEKLAESRVLHNLPLPEFDDTGFIGRAEEASKIERALRGAYPVITITGEGGLGKTALALKCCYDLIDSHDCSFEAVVWVTAKATKLTATEIKAIDGAIESSLGIFEAAAGQIDDGASGDPFDRLLDQLKTFPILLVIDNLETVLDENIRRLVENVPTGSKILFTSRTSIGAWDFPIPLQPFSSKEAEFLLRAAARFWAVYSIAKIHNQQAVEYCKRLQNNPLFIKWFVQTVALGQSPQSVLADPKIILEFCLSHVVKNLSLEAKRILYTLAFMGRSVSEAMLIYFMDAEPQDVQMGLNQLISSNLARMENATSEQGDTRYTLSSMALFYIRNFGENGIIDEKGMLAKKRALATAKEQLAQIADVDYYDCANIFVRDEGDYVAAKLLKDAMIKCRMHRNKDAETVALQARKISSGYFEVHRVLGQIHAFSGNLMRAQECFESAISLAPGHAPLRLFYGEFLFLQLEDVDAADAQFDEGLKLHSESLPLLAVKARSEYVSRRFEEGLSIILRAKEIGSQNTRIQRRLLDLHFQYYSRKIEHLVFVGKMSEAGSTLTGLRDFFEAHRAMVDSTIKKKLRKVRVSVQNIADFFHGSQTLEGVLNAVEWYNEEVSLAESAGDLKEWLSSLGGESIEGTLSSLHDKFGFIEVGDRRVFFHFGEWRGSMAPSEHNLGIPVTFKLGENNKGPCALSVSPVKASVIATSLGLRGIVSAVQGTYGFIAGDDGRTYFFPFSELIDPASSRYLSTGARISFDSDNRSKGKYPAARFVRLMERDQEVGL